MEYLVDAYNLLHAWDRALPEKDDLESARRRLLEALDAFSERKGARITAVFDGVDLPFPDRQAFRSVRVRFSRAPQDADRLIGEILDRTDHARDITVVSSDRAVRARASAAGSKGMDAAAFAGILRAPPGRPAARGTPSLSSGELASWAEAFGVSLEGGAPPDIHPLRPRGHRR